MKRWFVPTLALIGLALPAAAQAAPLEREHYSGSDSFDFDDCGFPVHDEVTFEGTFMLKAPRRPVPRPTSSTTTRSTRRSPPTARP